MAEQTWRSYLFVAIDLATRWVFVQIKTDKSAVSARSFLDALHKACPIKLIKLLTDNGKELTDGLLPRVNVSPVEIMNLTCCARIWGMSAD